MIIDLCRRCPLEGRRHGECDSFRWRKHAMHARTHAKYLPPIYGGHRRTYNTHFCVETNVAFLFDCSSTGLSGAAERWVGGLSCLSRLAHSDVNVIRPPSCRCDHPRMHRPMKAHLPLSLADIYIYIYIVRKTEREWFLTADSWVIWYYESSATSPGGFFPLLYHHDAHYSNSPWDQHIRIPAPTVPRHTIYS